MTEGTPKRAPQPPAERMPSRATTEVRAAKPGREKTTHAEGPPRGASEIAPEATQRFIEETGLVERLAFTDVCSAAYGSVYTSMVDARANPDTSSFAEVLAFKQAKARPDFDKDVLAWSILFQRCFPNDELATRTCRQLPNNIIQASFIIFAWDRVHGYGGSRLTEEVFKDRLKTIRTKRSKWSAKLAKRGFPAAANLLSMPIALTLAASPQSARAGVGARLFSTAPKTIASAAVGISGVLVAAALLFGRCAGRTGGGADPVGGAPPVATQAASADAPPVVTSATASRARPRGHHTRPRSSVSAVVPVDEKTTSHPTWVRLQERARTIAVSGANVTSFQPVFSIDGRMTALADDDECTGRWQDPWVIFECHVKMGVSEGPFLFVGARDANRCALHGMSWSLVGDGHAHPLNNWHVSCDESRPPPDALFFWDTPTPAEVANRLCEGHRSEAVCGRRFVDVRVHRQGSLVFADGAPEPCLNVHTGTVVGQDAGSYRDACGTSRAEADLRDEFANGAHVSLTSWSKSTDVVALGETLIIGTSLPRMSTCLRDGFASRSCWKSAVDTLGQ